MLPRKKKKSKCLKRHYLHSESLKGTLIDLEKSTVLKYVFLTIINKKFNKIENIKKY